MFDHLHAMALEKPANELGPFFVNSFCDHGKIPMMSLGNTCRLPLLPAGTRPPPHPLPLHTHTLLERPYCLFKYHGLHRKMNLLSDRQHAFFGFLIRNAEIQKPGSPTVLCLCQEFRGMLCLSCKKIGKGASSPKITRIDKPRN